MPAAAANTGANSRALPPAAPVKKASPAKESNFAAAAGVSGIVPQQSPYDLLLTKETKEAPPAQKNTATAASTQSSLAHSLFSGGLHSLGLNSSSTSAFTSSASSSAPAGGLAYVSAKLNIGLALTQCSTPSLTP